MRWLFLFLWLPITLAVHAQPADMSKLMSVISSFHDQHECKATLAGVWQGKNVLLQSAMGESMTGVQATTDMYVRIGGITETYLGTLLMILVDEGLINLDDKISRWLPDLLAADEVTVGMLIKNTAGYKDYVLNEEFSRRVTAAPFRHVSDEEIIAFSTAEGEMNFSPGDSSRYSHTEFTILGQVLTAASGLSMEALYQKYIFGPLNFVHTGYRKDAHLPWPVLHAYSRDRGIYEDATFWNPSWTGESGTLYANLHDLGRWGPIFGTGELLSRKSFKILTASHDGSQPSRPYFASGFVVFNGWYFQNPSFNGYSGAFGYHAESGFTVAIFTTMGEKTKEDVRAFSLFEELTKWLTPESPVGM